MNPRSKPKSNLKSKFILAWVMALWIASLLVSPALAAKSYLAERFDVDVVIQPDGMLNISETIVFRFTGGPFTYVFRELAFNNLDAIDDIQASLDGQALAQGTQPGQVEITTGRPIEVTWHFAPAQDTVHEFTLTYRVKGAIRQDAAGDTLIWRAIPEQHEYTINQGLIRIEYPAGVQPTIAPGVSVNEEGFEAGSTGTSFTLNTLDANTPVDIAVSFPGQSLISEPPAWQAEQQQRAQRTATARPYGLGAALFTVLLGVIGVIQAGRSFRRDAGFSQNRAGQSYSEPPRLIRPALAAKLTGSSVPFLGTLFDLAQRGTLRIEESPKWWGSRKFDLIRQPTGERLQPHERAFMDALFQNTGNERVALSEISSLANNRQYNQALDQELVAAGWRDAERSNRRRRFLGVSMLGLVTGLASLGAGLWLSGFVPETQPALFLIRAVLTGAGVAASVVALLGLIVAGLTSTLSDEGVRQASAWNSFSGYLRDICNGREPVASPDLFERYLPFAAGLGLATEWAEFFQKQANIPVPAWFMSFQSEEDDNGFMAIFSTLSSTDSSSSSSMGGDGGGASGGGASGAG